MLAETFCKNVCEVLKRKTHDYEGKGGDRLFNFRFAALVIDQAIEQDLRGDHLAYLSLICVKIARLISLLGERKVPVNEALDDTINDLIGYVALWGEHISAGRVADRLYRDKQTNVE